MTTQAYPTAVRQPPRGTANVEQLYVFILGYVGAHGYAPSMREMGAHMGNRSTSMVAYWLGKLELAGRIQRDYSVARGIQIVSPSAQKDS